MKDIPVCFVHTGNAKYVQTTIRQAEKYNNSVFLLGDESNKNYCKKWYNINDYYGKEYDLLKNRYKHMSTNSLDFEFCCFSRYLVVYNFAIKNNINELMLLDSDLMTYIDYAEIDWSNFDVGFSIPEQQDPYIWTISVHCSYWTIHALRSFIEYLLSVYVKDINLLEEKWTYDQLKKRNGGICDMTIVYLWYKTHPEFNYYNTSQIHNGMVFDHFLASSEGYRLGDFKIDYFLKMKLLKFEDGLPYFKSKDNKWIRACTIHAQGCKKMYIQLLDKGNTVRAKYYLVKIYTDYKRLRNGVLRILKKK